MCLFHVVKSSPTSNWSFNAHSGILHRFAKCIGWSIYKKVAVYVGIIWRLKHILHTNVLLMLYNSWIVLVISYCNTIWCHGNNIHIHRLSVLHLKAVWAIYNAHYLKHNLPLVMKLNILPIISLTQLQLGTFMYSAMNICFQTPSLAISPFNSDKHKYNTRTSHYLRQFSLLAPVSPLSSSLRNYKYNIYSYRVVWIYKYFIIFSDLPSFLQVYDFVYLNHLIVSLYTL